FGSSAVRRPGPRRGRLAAAARGHRALCVRAAAARGAGARATPPGHETALRRHVGRFPRPWPAAQTGGGAAVVRTPRARMLIEQIRRDWPLPDEAAVESSLQLVERIMAAIAAAGGAIGFDEYMRMALYEPGLGYYSGGSARFGKGGDFVTAPLLSPLFSRTLARQCADCLEAMAQPVILELGAGTGEMAAELLAELATLERLPSKYLILELSGSLRAQQQETLQRRVPELLPRIEWLDRLPEQPFEGMVLANEVLDALPVQLFRIRAGEVLELAVGQEDGRLVWIERPAPEPLQRAVARIQEDLGGPLPDGYTSE